MQQEQEPVMNFRIVLTRELVQYMTDIPKQIIQTYQRRYTKIKAHEKRMFFAIRRHIGSLCTHKQPGVAVLRQQTYGVLALLFWQPKQIMRAKGE